MVPEGIAPKGVAHPGVLDAFAYDARRETLVLAMYETRPWTGGEPQLLQLQEKLNAYEVAGLAMAIGSLMLLTRFS